MPAIKRILLEKGAAKYPATSRVLKNLIGIPAQPVPPEKSHFPGACKTASYDLDKASICLVPFKGHFLKPCPGTKGYICCGYQILHVGTNCPLDCSYCILQTYFNQPYLRLFINLEEHLKAIARRIDDRPDKVFRIGTGEFTDSLALDPIMRWSDILLPFFSKRKNAVLELKTKTDHIQGLLKSKVRERIIVSWSLNSPAVAVKDEKGAAALKKRLKAAKKCQSEGFSLGFHFDPLIYHPDWKDGYLETLELLDRFIDPKGIIWISMGCFRYMPQLKTIIRKRHPGTHILDGEFVPALDGKMRYFKPIRMEMYSFMAEMINRWHRDPGLYLCMESDEVWKKSLGWSPGASLGLSEYLDGRVITFFM